ncbi:MAG: DUF2752 domain-containing protein [Solirubrobacterales bacterium]
MRGVRRASRRQRMIAVVITCGVLGSFASLWLLQRVGFDFGLIFPPCGLRMRTGLTCPTCGMTHAVLAFARGEILTAFYLQPAAGLLCSLLVLVAFFAFLIAVSGVYFSFLDRLFAEVRIVHVVVGLLVILAAGWAVTLARALAAQT